MKKFLVMALLFSVSGTTLYSYTNSCLPGGSYSETCSDCTVDNNVLRCSCRKDDQSYMSTSLTMADIQNLNGRLKNTTTPFNYRSDSCLPGGSYYESCRDCRTTDTNGKKVLTCSCREEDGAYMWTSIPLFDIQNLNGTLTNTSTPYTPRPIVQPAPYVAPGANIDTTFSKLLYTWQNANFWRGTSIGANLDPYREKQLVKNYINSHPSLSGDIAGAIGETALIIACRFDDLDMAQFILEETSNYNFKQGAKSAIHKKLALRWDNSDVKLTAKYQDDISGLTALEIVKRYYPSNTALMDLIEKYAQTKDSIEAYNGDLNGGKGYSSTVVADQRCPDVCRSNNRYFTKAWHSNRATLTSYCECAKDPQYQPAPYVAPDTTCKYISLNGRGNVNAGKGLKAKWGQTAEQIAFTQCPRVCKNSGGAYKYSKKNSSGKLFIMDSSNTSQCWCCKSK
jgi:hypothetical protein